MSLDRMKSSSGFGSILEVILIFFLVFERLFFNIQIPEEFRNQI